MRQLASFFVCLLAFLASPAPAQVAHHQRPGAVACQLQAAQAELGVREKTGNNDGPAVEARQRAAGARPGKDPWCGCEMYWQQQSCHLPAPAWPAAAANWSRGSDLRTFFIRGLRGSLDSVRVGHIVTFYYSNLGRVGHVGKVVGLGRPVRAGRAPRTFLINAGNTGRGGGRDASDNGAGVHNIEYPAYQLYAVANWSY